MTEFSAQEFAPEAWQCFQTFVDTKEQALFELGDNRNYIYWIDKDNTHRIMRPDMTDAWLMIQCQSREVIDPTDMVGWYYRKQCHELKRTIMSEYEQLKVSEFFYRNLAVERRDKVFIKRENEMNVRFDKTSPMTVEDFLKYHAFCS